MNTAYLAMTYAPHQTAKAWGHAIQKQQYSSNTDTHRYVEKQETQASLTKPHSKSQAARNSALLGRLVWNA